jgi:hypothetical protein
LYLEKIIEKQQTIKFYEHSGEFAATEIDENNLFCLKYEKQRFIDFQLILLSKDKNNLIRKIKENKIEINYENHRIISFKLFIINNTYNVCVNFQYSSIKGSEEKSEIHCYDKTCFFRFFILLMVQ